ncbi:MAG: hypothetical protein U0903_19190 [Planctomycetales bacterium]
MRILVISNLGLIRQTVEQSLHGEGHTIQTAESVPQAVDILRMQVNMDVIICEWAIRDQTAFDLYQQYRQMDRLSDHGEAPFPQFLVFETPGRMLTRTTAPVKRDVKAESLIALGCAEFIDKPIDRPFLKERIRKIELQRVSKMIREKQSESDSKEKRESCTGGGEARSVVDNDLVTTQLKAQLLCLDEHAATTASHLQEVREAINQILGRVAAANQELVGAATGN